MINAADTAWLLVSGLLVLFMTPGLALFYGGMVRAKSALNMMMMSFSAMAVVTLIWVLYGYSLAFGEDHGGFIGSLKHLGLRDTLSSTFGSEGHQTPTLAFSMFQLTFAIITVALLSGAIADRVKFSSWLIFVGAWITFVYLPISHWVFAPGGWITSKLGALDFAGGTVVEINSGVSALALALVIGPRLGFKRDPMRPHNMPLVLLGAGILWFGWFGFNGGSALTVGALASTAVINTQIAASAAAITWILTEKIRDLTDAVKELKQQINDIKTQETKEKTNLERDIKQLNDTLNNSKQELKTELGKKDKYSHKHNLFEKLRQEFITKTVNKIKEINTNIKKIPQYYGGLVYLRFIVFVFPFLVTTAVLSHAPEP